MLFLSYARLLDLCEIRANKARADGVELIGVVRVNEHTLASREGLWHRIGLRWFLDKESSIEAPQESIEAPQESIEAQQ
jgi:hypothetical protein